MAPVPAHYYHPTQRYDKYNQRSKYWMRGDSPKLYSALLTRNGYLSGLARKRYPTGCC